MNKKDYSFYIPFLMLFIILILWHFKLNLFGDDLVFLNDTVIDPLTYFNYRYNDWSSRNLIEFVMIEFLKMNHLVWQVLDSLIFTGIAIITTKLLTDKKDIIYSIITSIFVLMFIYSAYYALASCGFLTTTINYIWPLFCIILNLYLLKKIIKKEFKSKLIYLISIITLIFGVNNEQLCVITFLIYALLFIYLKYKKINVPIFFYISGIIILISAINVAICPGNLNRYYVEISENFPEYINATILDKINIGTSNIINFTTTECDIVTLLLFTLIGLYSYVRNKISIKTIICFLPLIITSIFWILILTGNPTLNTIMYTNIGLMGYYPINIKNFIYSIIIYLAIIIPLIYGFYNIFKLDKKLGVNVILLIIISVASAIMYGFTPSKFSLSRMYIYFYFINMIINLYLIFYLLKNKI